jgi:uncharacterized protein YndB with AHSA1/START domain
MTKITVEATIQAPVEKVWKYWTNPEHIVNWSFASDDWHSPAAENDLREGGKFSSTMAAKDGSMSFDFWGVYTKIDDHKVIDYTMGDGRTVAITFSGDGDTTKIVETFEAESENSVEMQQGGWQAILNNFKKYTEAN